MNLRDLPNLITVLRILLVPPVALLLVEGDFGWALVLFAAAGVSDGIDGYLARRFGWRSRLGAFLDPFADKLLMLAVYLTLGWEGHLPAWLVAAVIGRDVIIVVGAVAYQYLVERLDIRPSYASKLNTVFQILLVVVLLLGLSGVPVPPQVITLMIYIVLGTTVASGAGYVWEWGRRLVRAVREKGDTA